MFVSMDGSMIKGIYLRSGLYNVIIIGDVVRKVVGYKFQYRMS